MGALIEVRDLRKAFRQADQIIEVLRGIDLEVGPGERVAIVGASGVGKSTLLHIMGGLERPSSGEVLFAGVSLCALDARRLAAFRNRRIGFVFQFHHLLPEFTALENVMMPALIAGVARAEAEQRARAILGEVGLGDRLTHKPGALSGGEQQRVAVARALSLRPDVLLADEPTGNLDARTGEGVHELLVRLNEELGTTLVIVTHNPSLTKQMTRVVRMHDGRTEEGLPPEAPGRAPHRP
ncbi:MAG: ABC transporter ATP-binding protein [Deltaproteobacteria bacterium]|nr:ABC transporter ATP-binding protein [Deltaproteobacteria bacterium]MBI3077803.1 ABC transporter ATP-binding protein [Deltaproteobacteria bacterium]